ncbi:BRO-N domain-containing protein [Methylohalobius crimeensis]|uniref:BRO-N domain-containing protein n=1 Tax=Methylohalobius crimeensis TaxID=244365 RepID=UPI0003B43299|nr:Bro-N domain-containing protein [Methylohalobius crimeensis]
MNNLMPFNFDNQEIRVVMIDGEPWFVARDVAEALGYANPAEAVRDHIDEDDVVKRYLPEKSNNYLLINESGVYALIFGSKLEAAKPFKRWVTSELLPTIRKTGRYAMPAAEPMGPQIPSHEADKLVAADRIFRAMMRSARAAGMSMPVALKRANIESVRQTGIDMLEKTGCVMADDESEKDWSEHGSAILFARGLAQGEFSPLHEYPMKSLDLFDFYRDWCKAFGHWAESHRALIKAMIDFALARKVRPRIIDLGTGEPGNPHAIYVLPGVDVPNAKVSHWYSHWSSQARSEMDEIRNQWASEVRP